MQISRDIQKDKRTDNQEGSGTEVISSAIPSTVSSSDRVIPKLVWHWQYPVKLHALQSQGRASSESSQVVKKVVSSRQSVSTQ